jgi:GMP synthase (glutamine-hydrolysing)
MLIHVIQHIQCEGLGILEEIFTSQGHIINTILLSDDHCILTEDFGTSPDLLIILGAPFSVNDIQNYPFLAIEIKIIQKRMQLKRFTLGICLGAQLITKAIGGDVVSTQPEIGWGKIKFSTEGRNSILSPLQDINVLHWHGEECINLPNDIKPLASTNYTQNQAFLIQNHTLGLQFHIEIKNDEIEDWIKTHSGDLKNKGIDLHFLRADTEKYSNILRPLAEKIVSQWLIKAKAEHQYHV